MSGGWGTTKKGTCHIRAVALPDTAHINDNTFAMVEDGAIWLVMWVSGIGTKGDNGVNEVPDAPRRETQSE